LRRRLRPGASVSALAWRTDIGTGQIYRWRCELCDAVAGFAEVVVAPSCERPETDAASVEIAVGADIRVRIPGILPVKAALLSARVCEVT
jgi:transposase-like protein